VPFYVAAPLTSVDFTIPSGEHIVIEERPECEMTCIGEQRIAAAGKNYIPQDGIQILCRFI
jgi:methylthioribose-1-phosphate isomerase